MVPVPDAGRGDGSYLYTLATPLSYTRGESVSCGVARVSGDGSDTLTGVSLGILEVSALYESDGPDSDGGTFDVPPLQV